MSMVNLSRLAIIFLAACLIISTGCNEEPTAPEQDDEEDRTPMQWADNQITNEDLLEINRPVYLYIRSNICFYCDKMSQETFPVYRVRQLMNEYYVSIEINVNHGDIVTFLGDTLSCENLAKRFNVEQFPTSIFLDPQLEELAQMRGYRPHERFADSAGYIATGLYETLTFEEYLALPADQRP